MKRGKRTVVVKNAFEDQGPEEDSQTSQQQVSPSNIYQPRRQEYQQGQAESRSGARQYQSQIQANTVRDTAKETSSGEAEQDKKSRIELLKQKYLKKSTEPTTKVVENEPKSQQSSNVKPDQIKPKEQTPQIPQRVVNPPEPIYQQQQAKPPTHPEEDEQLPPVEDKPSPKRVVKTPPPPPVKKGLRQPPPPKPRVIQEPQVQQQEEQNIELQPQQQTRQKLQPNPVQQILSKKLNNRVPVPKKRQAEFEERQNGEADNFEVENSRPHVVSSSMPLDEQYLDRRTEVYQQIPHKPIPTVHKESQFDLEEAIRNWSTNSTAFFEQFFPPSNPLSISLKEPIRPSSLTLKSKNADFTSMMSNMLIEFVFGSENELTEGQRVVLNEVALDYFFSSGSELAVQFLLLIVKLGSSHLKKYSSFFKENSSQYCLTILRHRNCFITPELGVFVDFILDSNTLTEDDLYLLLLLQPTEHLSTFIASYSFANSRNLVLSLAACSYSHQSNKPVLGIQFRLLSALVDTIPTQTVLLESVLNYVSHMDISEKYYQIHKQVKLKIINSISASQQSGGRVQNRQNSKEEGKGIMGIWSKASDFIKTTANQLVKEEKQKTIGGQKQVAEEPPEDDIEWDPVARRYRINGEIPKDDSMPTTNPSDPNNPNPVKKPAPPPAPKPKGVAPPPPLGRKARTVTATNRYA